MKSKSRSVQGVTNVSRSKLIKQLDAEFSRYIRFSYANLDGLVECFTCPSVKHWKKMQAGHYVTRACRVLRWDVNNVRPQCYQCNISFKGKPIDFRENLVKELGEIPVVLLESNRNLLSNPTSEWLEEQIRFYKTQNALLGVK